MSDPPRITSSRKKLSETQENLSKAFGTLAIKEKLNTYYKPVPVLIAFSVISLRMLRNWRPLRMFMLYHGSDPGPVKRRVNHGK